MNTSTKNYSKTIGLIAGPVLFFLILFFYHPKGLSVAANAVLASTVWVAIWWITEAIPIAVAALLPIILFPLTGALSIKTTTAAFGHKFIFLFLGGFLIAAAIEKWNLHKRIALNIIKIIGTDTNNIIMGFMVATAFLSMWISNTATAVMMLPIGVAVTLQFMDDPKTPQREDLLFGKAMMLAIAYSASIGGVATLIGTPPNLILAGVVKSTYNIEITFTQWMMFGLPISIILLFICWKYLTSYAFDFGKQKFTGGKEVIDQELKELGKIGDEEKKVLVVFGMVAFLLVFRSFLKKIIPAIDDTIIALGGGILLFLIPSKKTGEKIISWDESSKIPWGILLLFGGGMALAEGFKSSGLAEWIASNLTGLQGLGLMVLIVIIVAAVNFLTEITSNMATTAMLLPVLAPMAISLEVHPYMLMVSATVAASCAFMLPVATPPNAIVFGAGYLKIPDMVKAGIWMNIISIIIISVFVYFVLPMIWGFEVGGRL